MAERRPLTARDVKGNVEGYSEMSDEAFARRFYSDRAELTGLGVPLHSQRDEFTGEELYTLRSENYFLDRLDLKDDELAALQTALFYLDGKFAYAEPLRLALQNLALGRPGVRRGAHRHRRARPRQRTRLLARARRAPLEARVGDLEAADDQVQLLVAAARQGDRAHAQPVRAAARRGSLVRRSARISTATPSGPSGSPGSAATSASRPGASATSGCRAEFDVEAHRVPRPWQIGETVGTARIAVQGDTAWWVHRTLADAGALEDGVFETPYARIEPLAGWVLRQNGRADPARAQGAPRRGRRRARPAARGRTTATAPRSRASGGSTRRPIAATVPSGPIAPERFGVLQALLAHVLSACGEGRDARARRRRARRALLDPARGAPGHALAAQPRQLRRRLLHGLRRGRRGRGHRAGRQGALRRRVPQAARS